MTCSRRSTTWLASVLLAATWAAGVAALGHAGDTGADEARRTLVEQAIVETVQARMGPGADVRVEDLLVTGTDRGRGRLVAAPEPAARLGRPIRFSLSRHQAG